ncbi:M14 family metallopeptidase [Streptomyces sp. Je 1-4]|uniref:M14 family metallopeptidase n=1 Tax=Streptomyces TaxID=1883 RepID=UPI00140F1E2D|nr:MULTISPECIES: M14 family metallopeptidase [unclassified Streptomyces]QIK06832.1 zinc carboxypeptidase [Streptomyces sp. ID38640]UYB40230.1 M14 family metallopeptidase [Streptomyces sp. Je 1-4]UZQ36327.1 M14 family metallopeptidase [Streptomyces sp. Je 1-4] [Streptomyces sp. Je 1-4 4N24]UZQ43745.1 M14 family metallopeptidase [Streptomyces sp. Je 1-4] [Streptomyces sp. Je 1-4 4N24_ara]
MRPRVRGGRTTVLAALLSLALAAPIAAAQAQDASSPGPTAGAARHAELPHQYEVTGPATRAERTALLATGVSIDEVHTRAVVITATRAQATAVRQLGYKLRTLPAPPTATTPSPHKPRVKDFPAGYANYHTYDEATKEIDALVAKYPEILSKQVIGTSHEGRNILALKLSKNVTKDEQEPEVLFTAHQHAREHLTVEMALYLLGEFTSKYGSDSRVTKMLDSREIWIIPDLNPDGGEYDIASGEFRSWRKNRQPNAGTSEVGTDLNRNWDFKWGCCGGSSSSPSSETYRGKSPASAPEVQVVSKFVHGRNVGGKQQIKAAIDFHTYSELVLWPFGFTNDDTGPGMTQDDHDAFATIGKNMAATNGYTPEQSSDLYITDGSIDDWLWGDQKVFAFTFEMYPSSFGSGGFYPKDSVIPKETARNREAVLQLLETADCVYRAIGKEEQYCSGN